MQSVSDLFEALNWKQLNRKTLVDRTRSVLTDKRLEMVKARAENEVEVGKAAQEKKRLAEKELEMVKTQADARVLWAEARAIKAELETATLRLKAKNLKILRSKRSVNLRHAIGKCIEGMARGRAYSPVVLLSGRLYVLALHDPMRLLYSLLERKKRFCLI